MANAPGVEGGRPGLVKKINGGKTHEIKEVFKKTKPFLYSHDRSLTTE